MEVDIIDLGAKYVFFEEGFNFVVEDNTEDLHDGHTLVSDLEIHAGTIVHKDIKAGLDFNIFHVW
jgi:hypothetical protein